MIGPPQVHSGMGLQRLLGDYSKFCSLYQENTVVYQRDPKYETAEEIIKLQSTLMLMKMNVTEDGEDVIPSAGSSYDLITLM